MIAYFANFCLWAYFPGSVGWWQSDSGPPGLSGRLTMSQMSRRSNLVRLLIDSENRQRKNVSPQSRVFYKAHCQVFESLGSLGKGHHSAVCNHLLTQKRLSFAFARI